jgi:hypothetical protein
LGHSTGQGEDHGQGDTPLNRIGVTFPKLLIDSELQVGLRLCMRSNKEAIWGNMTAGEAVPRNADTIAAATTCAAYTPVASDD